MPEPDLEDVPPFRSPVNIRLDNAEHELVALFFSRPYEERHGFHDVSPPLPAERELSRTLGCQDCEHLESGGGLFWLTAADNTDLSSRSAQFLPEMRTA